VMCHASELEWKGHVAGEGQVGASASSR
jgi:hypothetical protein